MIETTFSFQLNDLKIFMLHQYYISKYEFLKTIPIDFSIDFNDSNKILENSKIKKIDDFFKSSGRQSYGLQLHFIRYLASNFISKFVKTN